MAQYKSRHCMGDVSFSVNDFGFLTVRNYFETSHAKGPQDGAGASLKHKADMAVIRREDVIQNANELFDFARANLSLASTTHFQSQVVKLKRRVFFFVSEHDRDRPYRMFKEVKNNRTIHSILANGLERNLKIRKLSCYCEKCLQTVYEECANKQYVENWEQIEIKPERILLKQKDGATQCIMGKCTKITFENRQDGGFRVKRPSL